MFCREELYGCDADGNRGVVINNIELEKGDEKYIKEEMIEYIKENQPSYKEYMNISFTDERTGTEIEFEEYFDDYFTKAEFERFIEPEGG